MQNENMMKGQIQEVVADGLLAYLNYAQLQNKVNLVDQVLIEKVVAYINEHPEFIKLHIYKLTQLNL